MTLNAVREPATPRPGPAPRRTMTPLMSACVVLVVAMVAATNLAVPKLAAGNLHPSATGLLWIVDAYVLTFGCLLIPAGALGDRYGRKGVLLTGLLTFAGGCLLSAAAPAVPVMLAGRLVTGAAAAMIMPATLSLLLQVTEPARRPQAIAVWTAATGVAGAVGNVAGGVILQWLPWQGLFLTGAPAALLLAALVARLAPRGERHDAALDLVGALLLTLALFALLFGIIEGPERGWGSIPVLGGFAGAALLLAAFTWHALRAAHPLLDPRIFAGARLRGGVLGVTAAFFGLFALFFVNAQYLQYAKGCSPLVTGIAILPLVTGMVLVSRRSVAPARRFGERAVLAPGLLLIAGGLGLLSTADAGTPYPLYALFLVIVSVGMGLCVPTLSIGVMGALPPGRAGLGSGLNGAAREIGSALGVATLGTVLGARLTAGLPPALAGRAHSVGGALAAAGGDAAARAQVVRAFTDAMTVGYRVVALIVLVLAAGALSGFGPKNTE
ncbi:MFS transporter [Actinomadura macrotermitis]|uniref:Antiseptic resistance protein n=1 Tax=Actinomadura macrotermitis TaxID=2585200 RepID=A0A7K0BLE9_9ACTN|nr:MFS transporter [Actinomadura macrotermitis]MQY02005.1 Antiseptic resistance protein [Actinomadura macrotermitis]